MRPYSFLSAIRPIAVPNVLKIGTAVFLIFTVLGPQAHARDGLVAVDECMLILDRDILPSHWTWLKAEDGEYSVITSPEREDRVILKKENKLYQVTDSKKRDLLMRQFYSELAPHGSKPVVVDYPKIGKGLAFRLKKDEDNTRYYKENDDGVVQLPGYPPMYVHTIDGVKYIDVPHPDVVNAYVGRNLFLPYTKKTDRDGEIKPMEYWRIISHDRFPIAVSGVSSTIFVHDMIGHGAAHAVLHDHPVWKQTVSLAKRAMTINDEGYKRDLNNGDRRWLDNSFDSVLMSLSRWEIVANGSRIGSAKTPQELQTAIDATAARIQPSLDFADKKLTEIERKLNINQHR